MDLITILDFANVFFAGLLAGIEFVIHYGFHQPTQTLDDQPQLRFRQALVLRLRVLVPAFFVPTAVSGIGVTVFNRTAPGFWFRCGAMLAILTWVWTRVVGTVRINSDTLTWHTSAPPPDWKAQINYAERFHIVGTWAAVAAFALFLMALARKLTAD